jgi:hypothetical protein
MIPEDISDYWRCDQIVSGIVFVEWRSFVKGKLC